MGMDLIVHIVKGPIKLPSSKKAAAKELAQKAVHAAKAWLAYYETATDEEKDTWEESAITTQLRTLVEVDDFDFDCCLSSIESVAYLDTDKWIDEFYDAWPDLGRDTAWRQYNNQLVMAAGDSSWGDSPDGAGYTLLSAMWCFKGLAELLGIK